MSEWVSVGDRLPAVSGVYPVCSIDEKRQHPQDWLDSLSMFNADAEEGESKWQHSSGFYDNGVTHWLELPPRPV